MTRSCGTHTAWTVALVASATLFAAPSTPVRDRGNGSIYWGLTPCSGLAVEAAVSLPYYAIEMVSTKRVPGTGLATGTAHVEFARSPFGVAVTPGGDYVYDVELSIDRLGAPSGDQVYTAWVATSGLDQVARLGVLIGEATRLSARGTVAWNKFLVVVTLEPSADPAPGQTTWQGPVVLRGMSRSGLMHTLAGHGPFQQEPCLKYGYK